MLASSILNSVTFKRIAGSAITTPVNATFTAGAGTLAAGTYYYRVSALTPNGETVPSTETSLVLASEGGVNVNWTAVSGATGYKVYGRTTGAELFIALVVGATTYLDGGSITPAGAMPTINTTGSNKYPNMWNTLHADTKHGTRQVVPYCQPFDKNHVVYLQFESIVSSDVTVKAYNYQTNVLIETLTSSYTTTYGTTDVRYFFNVVVTLDSDYYDKTVYFVVTQGADSMTSEPIVIKDLTEYIANGTIKYLKYNNLDRVESDLDDRFIDWSALSATGNYLDMFIEAVNFDANDTDSVEVFEGSQSMSILSASYYTGKMLKTGGIPDYMIAKLGMISSLDIFMVNDLQYIKNGEIEVDQFGTSTSFQVSINMTQKNAIGINVDNVSIEETEIIISPSTTKMYVGSVPSASPDENEVKLMTELEAVKQDTTANYVITLGNRYCFAYPSSYGNLTSAINNFSQELLSGFVKTTVNFTFGANTVEMYIYTYAFATTFVPDPAIPITVTYKF